MCRKKYLRNIRLENEKISKGRLKFTKRTDKELGVIYFVEKSTCIIELAMIYFDPRWKKWIFRATSEMFIFDAGCLEEITKFMRTLE